MDLNRLSHGECAKGEEHRPELRVMVMGPQKHLLIYHRAIQHGYCGMEAFEVYVDPR